MLWCNMALKRKYRTSDLVGIIVRVLVREKNYDFKMWPQKEETVFIQTSDGEKRKKNFARFAIQFNTHSKTATRKKTTQR